MRRVAAALLAFGCVTGLSAVSAGAQEVGPGVAPVAMVDRAGVVEGDVVTVGAGVFGQPGTVRVDVWTSSSCSGPSVLSSTVVAAGEDVVWADGWSARVGVWAARASFVRPDGDVVGECVAFEPVAASSVFDAVLADGRLRLSGGRAGSAVAELRSGGCSGRLAGSVTWSHDGSVSVSPLLGFSDSVRVVLDDTSACVSGLAVPVPTVAVSDRLVASETAGVADPPAVGSGVLADLGGQADGSAPATTLGESVLVSSPTSSSTGVASTSGSSGRVGVSRSGEGLADTGGLLWPAGVAAAGLLLAGVVLVASGRVQRMASRGSSRRL